MKVDFQRSRSAEVGVDAFRFFAIGISHDRLAPQFLLGHDFSSFCVSRGKVAQSSERVNDHLNFGTYLLSGKTAESGKGGGYHLLE